MEQASAAEPRTTVSTAPNSKFQIPDARRGGQSLVEVLIAIAVGVVMVVGAITVIAPALKSHTAVTRLQVATALSHELLENVRVFAEGDWANIARLATTSATVYHLRATSSPFIHVTGTQSVVVASTTYTRHFFVDDVRRSGITIVTTGGSVDPSTKKVTVVSGWTGSPTSSISTYLMHVQNRALVQTDWSGGFGQDGPATTTNNRFATSSNINFTTTTGSIIMNL